MSQNALACGFLGLCLVGGTAFGGAVNDVATFPTVQLQLADGKPHRNPAAPAGAEAPSVVIRVYDNWTSPPSVLTSVFRAGIPGSNEIGDDLNLIAAPLPGVLDDMGINCANVDAPSNLTGGQLAIRFYTLPAGTLIAGFNANLPALALAAGGSARVFFGPGVLTSLGISIPASSVRVSLQWNTATFSGAGSIANLGFQTRSGGIVGSSADQFFNVTLGTPFNFGGNPVANTGFYLDTPVELLDFDVE